MENNITSTPANTMGAGDPVLPSETNTGNIGVNVKKFKKKKKIKSLTEFIEKDNITEAINRITSIKWDKGIADMLEYAHNNPPQTIVVEYTKLRWPKLNDENSRGILRLTSTGEEYDRWNKKLLISGTNDRLKDLECVVHIGEDKLNYFMVDVIGGRPKDKYESQMYVEFDNFYYE